MSEQTEYEQKRQEFVRRVVNKILEDPDFREKIIDDPFGTMESGDLGEAYHEMNRLGSDVQGYSAEPVEGDSNGCCGATCGGTY